MTPTTRVPVIAVIGCGAIVDSLYLPALRRLSSAVELRFIDASDARAGRAASMVEGAQWSTDYRTALDGVDGAIVAVPPSLHHAVALYCLERGIHVLCEKPLAPSLADARALIELAERRGLVLAVNNGRRLFPAFRETARLIGSGAIGDIRRLEITLGEAFDWPAASASYFGLAAASKGVLLDIGAHVLDLACWWLGEPPTLASYADDSLGGTEAYATVDLTHRTGTANITLSWLSRLDNRYRITGTRGVIAGEMYDWRALSVEHDGSTRRLHAPTSARSITEVAQGIVDNFVDVVRGRATPMVTGRDVLPSIALIEECYAHRQRIPMPWYDAMERIVNV